MVDKIHTINERNRNDFDELGMAWARMVNCITHDLRTPLASLRMTANGLDRVFARLMEGYKLALENKLVKPDSSITERYLNLLEIAIASGIENSVTETLDFLSLLDPYNQQLFSNSEAILRLNAQDCINETLKKHRFVDEKEQELLHIDCKYNFQFSCAPIFIEQLLANLLANALTYIALAGRGKINIWTEEEANYNVIHFKDTGKGMDQYRLSRVFNKFFSKANNVIIPGLGFCRLAMLQRGGNVLCYSKEEEYTDFVIQFLKTN